MFKTVKKPHPYLEEGTEDGLKIQKNTGLYDWTMTSKPILTKYYEMEMNN